MAKNTTNGFIRMIYLTPKIFSMLGTNAKNVYPHVDDSEDMESEVSLSFKVNTPWVRRKTASTRVEVESSHPGRLSCLVISLSFLGNTRDISSSTSTLQLCYGLAKAG